MTARLAMKRRILVLPILLIASACGGVTETTGPAASGGSGPASGGSGPASGGANPASGGTGPASGGAGPASGGSGPAIAPCTNPVAAGTACGAPAAHCVGVCSNSWQAENVCTDGTWTLLNGIPCGPDAAHAPQCRNSFASGQLTPCCSTEMTDCTGKPDGWPGFGCTPGEGSFCSCTCSAGGWSCGC